MIRAAIFSMLGVMTCGVGAARADVKVPAIFGDHMVVQRGMKVPVWGTADAGEKVTVKAAQREQSVTADARGKWRVALDAMEAGDEPITITITGKNSITINDVLVGEVWVCSGQSNMGFSLKSASNGAEAVKSADRPKMRLFMVGRAIKDQPQEDLSGGRWEVCTPQSAAGFSAVAYFFGRELQEKLNQPIGLIQPSWGGTRAEAWMPRETFDALKLPYEPEWTEQWLNPPHKPGAAKQEPPRPHEAPACLYNGMIAPIAGYAMRGVIWYQGETNTAYGEHYRNVLAALITSWRGAWGQGDPSTGSGRDPSTGSGRDFPFLVVQLANLKNSRFWPITREAQAQVSRELPNVGLAVTIDVGESNDIHPREKLTVGKRLALIAQKIAYGMDVPHSGPVAKSMEVRGSDAVIRFEHVDKGLVAKGDALQGFAIAGADGQFVPAKARIEGETVLVSADGVPAPTVVRYGWENDPTCTLYNKADLPAVPFEAKALLR